MKLIIVTHSCHDPQGSYNPPPPLLYRVLLLFLFSGPTGNNSAPVAARMPHAFAFAVASSFGFASLASPAWASDKWEGRASRQVNYRTRFIPSKGGGGQEELGMMNL